RTEVDQLGCQLRKTVVVALRIPVFDGNGLAFDITQRLQLLEARPNNRAILLSEQQYADASDALGRLRARRQRPRRRACDQADELPPPHARPPLLWSQSLTRNSRSGEPSSARSRCPWVGAEFFRIGACMFAPKSDSPFQRHPTQGRFVSRERSGQVH